MVGVGAEIGHYEAGWNPAQGPTISWESEKFQTLELHPAQIVGDRISNFYVSGDPWLVATLDAFKRTRAYFKGALTVPGQPPVESSEPVHLILSDTATGFRVDGDDYPGPNIFWPSSASYMATISPLPVTWMAAHEYVHALQYQSWPGRDGSCQSEDHCGDNYYYLSLNPNDAIEPYERLCFLCSRSWFTDKCAPAPSRRIAWSEGVADGLAEMFYRQRVDSAGTSYMAHPCTAVGEGRIGSVGGFVTAVAQRTPREFWYRQFHLFWQGVPYVWSDAFFRQYGSIAQTADQYRDMWHAQAPLVWYLQDATGSMIRPNPAADLVTFRIDGGGLPQAVDVQIFSVQGRVVRRVQLKGTSASSHSAAVSLRDLASGLYFARSLAAGREVVPVRRLVLVR